MHVGHAVRSLEVARTAVGDLPAALFEAAPGAGGCTLRVLGSAGSATGSVGVRRSAHRQDDVRAAAGVHDILRRPGGEQPVVPTHSRGAGRHGGVAEEVLEGRDVRYVPPGDVTAESGVPEGTGQIGDRSGVPRRQILVEGGGPGEDVAHVLDLAGVPGVERLVEGRSTGEGGVHVADRTDLPARDIGREP